MTVSGFSTRLHQTRLGTLTHTVCHQNPEIPNHQDTGERGHKPDPECECHQQRTPRSCTGAKKLQDDLTGGHRTEPRPRQSPRASGVKAVEGYQLSGLLQQSSTDRRDTAGAALCRLHSPSEAPQRVPFFRHLKALRVALGP